MDFSRPMRDEKKKMSGDHVMRDPGVSLFEEDGADTKRTRYKQASLSTDASVCLEQSLKSCLEFLAESLFGTNAEWRWTDTYFPFTHPSWELEVKDVKGNWLEVLGCGVVEQEILRQNGAGHKAGWAFGLGLERLAMRLYQIPDIRLFWSNEPAFLNQFDPSDPGKDVIYEPVSRFGRCINHISFFLPKQPEDGDNNRHQPDSFDDNSFFDLVRSVGGDVIEEVKTVDKFFHPKRQQGSRTYEIVYRHVERHLRQAEVNRIHQEIEAATVKQFGVEVR